MKQRFLLAWPSIGMSELAVQDSDPAGLALARGICSFAFSQDRQNEGFRAGFLVDFDEPLVRALNCFVGDRFRPDVCEE